MLSVKFEQFRTVLDSMTDKRRTRNVNIWVYKISCCKKKKQKKTNILKLSKREKEIRNKLRKREEEDEEVWEGG